MKVLLVGSGGREHALAWALAASPLVDTLYCAPGNAGTAQEAQSVLIAADNVDGLLAFAQQNAIDFVVVGPEVPLVLGLVDRLEAAGIAAFGPTAAAARLEGSKGFTKDLCAKYGIPTAAYGRFTDPAAARAWVRAQGKLPVVIKADGLAAGKGVVIAQSWDEADAAIDAVLVEGGFGVAGAELVAEEFMDGEEASFFVLADGTHALALASAQDHKRVGDGDVGPNTGGMGAYSPAPVLTPALEAQAMAEIIGPTLAGMAAEGCPYKGVLYAGLMLTREGPKLVEYNCRFGDPECQVLMPRLKSDLLPLLMAARDGQLDHVNVRWHDQVALTVVMAAQGYPGEVLKGTEIKGLEAAARVPGVQLFHAGTKNEGGRVLANGGRVLNITALGATVAEAQARAYQAVALIDWPEGFCRKDIGWREIARTA